VAVGTDPEPLSAAVAHVRVAEDPSAERTLASRYPLASEPRPVSVTDLLDPRRAFWRRLRGPAPVAPEREIRMELGRAWHRRFGDVVAEGAALEVRLRRGGVSARIDVLADVPTEVKTAASGGEGSEPIVRPEHVEQLAFYCALAGRPVGRLVHIALAGAGPAGLSVADLEFRDLGAIEATIARREAQLRSAWAARSSQGLERCRWWGVGCEYRAAGLCDCRGDEPAPPEEIAAQIVRREPRPELAARWTTLLAKATVPPPTVPARFRDLVHPRRTYFRLTSGAPPDPFTSRPPGAPLDGYERAIAALERGPVGELRRLPTDDRAPDDEVLGWKDRPVLVRGSRARTRLTVDDLKTRFPQYVLELGFRCASAGAPSGTVVVGLESAGPNEPAAQVFDLDFAAAGAGFGRLWDDRRGRLLAAREHGAPETLEACPAWMFRDCPYRERCACGDGRSQR
jgi:hypothetical protein